MAGDAGLWAVTNPPLERPGHAPGRPKWHLARVVDGRVSDHALCGVRGQARYGSRWAAMTSDWGHLHRRERCGRCLRLARAGGVRAGAPARGGKGGRRPVRRERVEDLVARVEDDLARLRAAWARYGQQVTGTDEAAALAAIGAWEPPGYLDPLLPRTPLEPLRRLRDLGREALLDLLAQAAGHHHHWFYLAAGELEAAARLLLAAEVLAGNGPPGG